MMAKYVQRSDGDVIDLGRARQHLIACCDCGLVHLLKFKIRGGNKLSFQAWRRNRNTAQRRRGMK
jgi:hypothetical protein